MTRNRLYRLLKRGFIDRPYFNSYKNKLNRVLRLSKQLYFNNSFIKAENNIKSTWSIINKTLNRTKSTTVDSLTINNEEVTDKSEICNAFNSFFVSIVSNFDNNFGGADNMLDILHPIGNSALFIDSDHIEIYDTIRSLKSSSNLNMPTKFLKLFAPFISPILSDLFNQCLNRGVYPDVLKEASVTPVFKSGDRGDPGNYRPISVLSDVNKLYEEMMLSRLNSFIEHNNIMSKTQYGFRAKTSTQEACIDLLSILLSAYTKKNYAIVLFIDFKKAFDTVNHERLLQKLSYYGIRGVVLDLFSSYLTNRKQKVAFQGASSDYLPIVSGVPQGSKLGPVLFNLYVNDIACLSFDNNNTFQFADDTAFVSTDNDLQTLVERFNANMNLFFSWCQANKLFLNLNKTKAMIITPKHYELPAPPIMINNSVIEYVKEYKYLGIVIDSQLTFKAHVNALNSRLNRLVGAAYSIKYILSIEAALTFYYTIVRSLLSYAITVWGRAPITYLNKLQVTQNKIVRHLFSASVPHTHTSDIYSKLKILKVCDIYKLELGKLMYMVRNTQRYPKMRGELDRLAWTHCFATRSTNTFRLPYARVNTDHNSTLFAAVSLWNDLPNYIKQCSTAYSSSRSFKDYILNTY